MSPPIVTDGAMMAPERGIHEFGAGFGESIGATAAEAWADSPLSQLRTGSEIANASGDMPDFGRLNDNTMGGVDLTEEVKPAVPRLDMIDALDRVKKAGLDKHLTLPNQPDMPQAQLDIMMRNAKARAEREATVERGPQGFIPSALQVGTSFLVGAADPINLASAFIPIMGELRYGKLLASAGDRAAARFATRAAVGAGQGAVGQAALEPLDWWAHTQEGRDFGMSDVLHNIMFGAALGGAMHAGGGFISDAYRMRQGRALYPFGPGEALARVPDVGAAPAAPQAAEAPFRRIEAGGAQERPAPVGPDADLEAAVSRIEERGADFRALDAEYGSARIAADETRALWEGAVERFGRDSPEALALQEAHDVDRGRAATLEGRLEELESRAPSPEVETINDLPPRAHEDAMRVAISDLISGEPVRAGDVIAAAAQTDPRIAESVDAPRGQKSHLVEVSRDGNVIKYEIRDPVGNLAGSAKVTVEGNRAKIDDVRALNPDGSFKWIEDAANTMGPRAVRDLIAQLREQHPEVSELTGLRISGARGAEKDVVVRLPSARGVAANELTKAADWRGVSAQRPDFNDPDIVAASNAAAKVEPPRAKIDERVAAAEKADAYAQKMYDLFAHRLPPEERARLEEAIATLDRQKADIDVVTERGAACLFEARGG